MRKSRVYAKHYGPDPVYGRTDIGRFTNYLMKDGKKSVAERVLSDTFSKIKEKTGQDPVSVFEQAMKNAAPTVELMSRRVGGANYQIPTEVRDDRRFILAARWIIGAARGQKGSPVSTRLAAEIVAAAAGEGTAIKKKNDTHKMAEANRAFSHFARFTKKKKTVV